MNKVLRNWIVSANLDLSLHQHDSFYTKSHPPPSWSFKWSVRPPSCDNTALPSPGIFLYLHSSLGLFLGLYLTSGIYQHRACWKMDGLEKSERRVKLGWKCLAASLGKARKSLNNWQEQSRHRQSPHMSSDWIWRGLWTSVKAQKQTNKAPLF